MGDVLARWMFGTLLHDGLAAGEKERKGNGKRQKDEFSLAEDGLSLQINAVWSSQIRPKEREKNALLSSFS
jgi:hypothetical protein